MSVNQLRGFKMTLSAYTIALVAVIITGYIMAVGLGTIAYFANKKNY
jgi:hypothetical protein